MKEGWVIASLDDACNVDYGTRIVQSKSGGTIYPVYGGGGETFRTDTFNRKDCIVIARFAMSKTCVRFVPGEFFLNDSGLSVSAKEGISQGYLEKYMFYLNDDIYNLGKGAAQRNLDVKQFRKLPVKYPVSLELQQSIVSELDLINELIAKKKAQLADLDSLAQSLFYEMFGDPVENEKGWEVKKYEDICSLITDGEHSTPERSLSGIYLLSARNVWNHELRLDDVDFISESEYSRIAKRIEPKENDILISCSGSVGRVCSIPSKIKCQMVRSVALLRPKESLNHVFMEYLVASPYTQLQINNSKTESAQANLFQGKIKKLKAIIPPLSLQQTFASRIEAIEEEKQKIQSSLKDLETLLAARMQYWFE